jgi:hypothetical protein
MSNTSLDPAVFEQIVQEVIRRLLDRGVGVSDKNKSADPATDLEIDGKLVTLATLRNRLNGVGKLLVGRRTVVTPAVIDELKDRGIELVRR